MAYPKKLAGPLGQPMGLREVAELVGCSPWTVRHVLLPKGLPHLRAGAGGRLIFYRRQVVAWIKDQLRQETRKKGGSIK